MNGFLAGSWLSTLHVLRQRGSQVEGRVPPRATLKGVPGDGTQKMSLNMEEGESVKK